MKYLLLLIIFLQISCKRNTTYYQCKAYDNGYITFDIDIPENFVDSLDRDTVIVYKQKDIIYIKYLK